LTFLAVFYSFFSIHNIRLFNNANGMSHALPEN
jgi:hypothetical protein